MIHDHNLIRADRSALERLGDWLGRRCWDTRPRLSPAELRLLERVIAALACCLLMACGPVERIELPAHLDTSSLDAEREAAVLSAAAEWLEATGGAVDLMGADGDAVPVTIADLSSLAPAGMGVDGMTEKRADGVIIELDVALALDSIREVAMHEIGHALGLPHGPGLMAPLLGRPACVDAESLRLVCEVYACGPGAHATC